MIPRISMDEAINSDLNTGSSRQVLQRVDPLSVDLGFFDYHPRSVSYRIRYVKGKRRYFLVVIVSVFPRVRLSRIAPTLA